MGFGLLLLGYITVLGVLPESFVYFSYGIYIAITGGIIMLMGFLKLEEYNVYFKFMKYITIVYILILLGFTPFVVPRHSEEFMTNFTIASKIIRISFMFVFHFYLLQGILKLGKEINNFIIEKKAKRNILFTYIFFASFILELFNIFNVTLIAPILMIFCLIYFAVIISLIYSCYMKITYEGHDEAIEEKYNLEKFTKKSKNNANKNNQDNIKPPNITHKSKNSKNKRKKR